MWSMGSELANLIFLRTAGCKVMITSDNHCNLLRCPHTHSLADSLSFFSIFFYEMASRYECKVLTYTDCVPLDNPRKLLGVASLL